MGLNSLFIILNQAFKFYGYILYQLPGDTTARSNKQGILSNFFLALMNSGPCFHPKWN